jgi:hypothetical protein
MELVERPVSRAHPADRRLVRVCADVLDAARCRRAARGRVQPVAATANACVVFGHAVVVRACRGREALHRLEDAFYSSVLADPLLQPLFGAGRPEHVDHLTAFTAESFGGPDRFSRELGFAHLIAVHRGLKITEEQRPVRAAVHERGRRIWPAGRCTVP